MGSGRTLELFLIDGSPDGMLTAEVFNWTGHILKSPRTQIKKVLERRESSHTGVYLLLGHDDDGTRAYIGESECVGDRLKGHISQKDWWTDVVIITTSSDALHKAHVKYLEARIVAKAHKAGTYRLENSNQPTQSSLSEASQASMEEFLETLDLVLPAIRVDVLKTGQTNHDVSTANEAKEKLQFVLELKLHGIEATAIQEDGNFVVLSGSRARGVWASKGVHNFGYKELHDRLVKTGVIANDENGGVFAVDYAFNSPSAAAAVVCGRTANGRIHWKLADGTTYADWEASTVERLKS